MENKKEIMSQELVWILKSEFNRVKTRVCLDFEIHPSMHKITL